jgi:hypothetical protein
MEGQLSQFDFAAGVRLAGDVEAFHVQALQEFDRVARRGMAGS